jgi:hypothetical protein
MTIIKVMLDPTTEARILRALHDQNAWWTTNRIPVTMAKPFKRRDFYTLKDKIQEKEITAIIGPRQVGKTTILHQLIEHLIKRNVDPKRILYLSFDYPYLTAITKTPLNDVLEVYTAHVLREPVQRLRKQIYVFLDEVCKLQDWSRILKGWYDLNYPIKFIVTDSSSSDVLKGTSEALVGRITPYIMLSMKFVDTIKFYEERLEDVVNKYNWEARRAFQEAVKNNQPRDFFDFLRERRATMVPYEPSLKIYLNKYLLRDGYPELLKTSLARCAEKLRNYLSLTIYKDIMRVFKVRDPKALEDLVLLLAEESSQRIEYSSLARNLSIKRDTLLKYLDYLESVYLISRAGFYSRSRASRIRKTKKIYLLNVGLRNALLGTLRKDLLEDLPTLGKISETVVHDHCKRLKFVLEGGISTELFYWRTPQGNEIDIIMELFKHPIPLEVKYRNNIPTTDLKGMHKFLAEYKTFGIVVTKDLLDYKDRAIFIPLWMFLLMC